MLHLGELKRKLKHLLPLPISDAVLKLKYRHREIEGYMHFVDAIKGGEGLEVGGPSTIFKTVLPVYQAARRIDGVNFAARTVWEGGIQNGMRYRYLGNRVGRQFISDATDLSQIGSEQYDFVLSSNCLEHVANPIRALLEWRRVVRSGGKLILVLPNKASNFDHRRPITPIEHILEDYRSNVSERDLTHLEEILSLHDLSLDPPAGDPESFRRRSLDNFSNRTLHHHVFDPTTMSQMLQHVGFDVVQVKSTATDHYALSVKTAGT